MKVKSLLLTFSCAAALTAAAQPYSGSFVFKVKDYPTSFSEEVMETTKTAKGLTKNDVYLCTWFDSDFSEHVVDFDEMTFTPSSIYDNTSGAELILTKQKTINNASKLHGIYVEPEQVGDLVYVTVPDQYLEYGEEAEVTKPGTIVFHIGLGGAPQRINDENNIWGAYLYGMNGAKVVVSAPAGSEVKAYFNTPGLQYKDILCSQPVIVDFEPLAKDGFNEIKSGEPYNSDAILNPDGGEFSPTAWAKWVFGGYCCKFVDIAVSNVKPGDRVGFGGIQTLYPGCTEVELAGVSENIMDDFSNAPAVYYNLHGMEIANPSNGIFIKRQGNKVSKVIL